MTDNPVVNEQKRHELQQVMQAVISGKAIDNTGKCNHYIKISPSNAKFSIEAELVDPENEVTIHVRRMSKDEHESRIIRTKLKGPWGR